MDKLILMNGAYFSLEEEKSPQKCHINLTNRIKLLTNSEVLDLNCLVEVIDHVDTLCNRDYKENLDCFCLCGHLIQEIYVVKLSNGKNVGLGSECIKRLKYPDENKNIIQKFKEENKSICKYCDKLVYEKSHYKNRLKSCIKIENDKKILKRCVDCNKLKVPILPSWKIRCVSCYIWNKNNQSSD